MKDLLDIELRKAYAVCKGFQLIKIQLPDSYEDAIVQTQVEVQRQQMKRFEKTAMEKRKQIQVLESESNSKIAVINSEGNADAYYKVALAQGEGLKSWLSKEADIYALAKKSLGLNSDELIEFLFLQAVIYQEKKDLILDIDSPTVMLNVPRS
jgi:hypothetical protein